MARVIVGMVMSLDGFVNERNGDLRRLYPDMEAMRQSKPVQDAIRATGAVVMGRRTYEMASDYTGYEFQVPIFVVTHEAPASPAKGENDRLSFTFVDGVARAVEQAKAAAGERDVTVVGGANVIRQCLAAGLADEVQLDIRAILLGDGLRLFERTDVPPIDLEPIDVSTSPGITHVRYRVRK